MFLNCGITKKVEIKVGTSSVSKMYPNGIQFKNLSNVSRVTVIRLIFWELALIGFVIKFKFFYNQNLNYHYKNT